ncbi:MAG: 50S ribosomal protein L25 [Armatimonadota bacterium]
MDRIKLEARVRDNTGKSANKKIRMQGGIPATVYGKGDSQSISLKFSDFIEVLRIPGGRLSVIDMNIGDVDASETPVMIQSIQRDPVTDRIIHVDFQRIIADEPVNAEVPLVLIGEAPGTKQAGILEQLTTNINIKSLPDDVPTHIDVDISHLELGDKVYVRDLKVPENVEVIGPSPETLAVAIHMPNIRVEGVSAGEESALIE